LLLLLLLLLLPLLPIALRWWVSKASNGRGIAGSSCRSESPR